MEVRYEGYGPGGAAVLIDCMTDNRNRTVSEIRHVFAKFNGNLGTSGSVAYLFSNTGVIRFASGADENLVMESVLEAGADDIVDLEDGGLEVITGADEFPAVVEALEAKGLVPDSAEITMRASTAVPLSEKEGETMLRLLDMLDTLDDVQNVYSNAEIPDTIFEMA